LLDCKGYSMRCTLLSAITVHIIFYKKISIFLFVDA
jgi:hypothetical protein